MTNQHQTKKKVSKAILSTLAAIAILPSVPLVNASTEDNPTSLDEVIDEDIQNNIDEIKHSLSNTQREHIMMILETEENNITEVLNKGIINHASEDYEKALENYTLVLNHEELPEQSRESINDLINLMENELIEKADEENHEDLKNEVSNQDQQVDSEIEDDSEMEDKKALVEESEEIEGTKETETVSTFRAITENINSADEMFEAVINAPIATAAWSRVQDFKESHPEDDRLVEAINDAGRRIYNMGKNNHETNNFSTATHYYGFLLNEDLIDSDLKSEISVYNTQANRQQDLMTSEDMYEAVFNAPIASAAWSTAQDYKEYYPKSDGLVEAVNDAARRIYNMGKNNHEAQNYSTAMYYYEFLLSEPLVNEKTLEEVEIFYIQASNDSKLLSESDMYDDVVNASTASQAWNAAKDFKEYYPKSNRLNDAFESAGRRIYNMGTNVHENQDFNRAVIYYNRLLNEPYISDEIKNQVSFFIAQAEEGSTQITESDLLQRTLNANNATQAWSRAQDFKSIYPNASKLSEAFESAGQRIYNMGMSSQKSRDFNTAIYYYDLLLGETQISSIIKNRVQFFKNQADNKSTRITVNDLLQATEDAVNATQAWSRAQDFKSAYPGSSRLPEAFESAGRRIYNMGKNSHKDGNYKLGIYYYELLIEEPLVNELVRTEVEGYRLQAQNNKKYTTPTTLYNKTLNASTASEAWNIAQEFKKTFPQDSRVNKAINDAGSRNYSMGITNHKNSNFSQALFYYNRLADESLINDDFSNDLNGLIKLARNNKELLSKQGYKTAVKNASTSSEAWNLAVEGISIYPDSSYTKDALTSAAHRNLKLGRSYQRNNNTSQAIIYFNRIRNENKVDDSIQTLATVFSNQLSSNYKPVVYLDSGHGGSDPGAVSQGVQEKILNLNTAEYLKTELESRGYIVMMSRTSDVFMELTERATSANDALADIFISVHYNSMGGSGRARGIETFIHHTVAGGFGQEPNHENFLLDNPRIDESLRLAEEIHSDLIQSTSMNDRGVKGNNYNVLRNTDIPAVLLELGFMDNTSELAKITNTSYQKTAAHAVADGIDSYFNSVLR